MMMMKVFRKRFLLPYLIYTTRCQCKVVVKLQTMLKICFKGACIGGSPHCSFYKPKAYTVCDGPENVINKRRVTQKDILEPQCYSSCANEK